MQLIPNAEDRTFTSSIGHWTGDGEWDPGPVGGKTGLQKLLVPGDQTPVTITLQYPYVKPRADIDNTLNFNVAAKDDLAGNLHYTLQLTDGNYNFTFEQDFGFTKDNWDALGDVYSLPDDWDETQATLNITMQQNEDENTEIVFDDFSLEAELAAKADHLPLMGVH